MTNDDKIRDEKLQCHIIRKAAKISALSSGKIDKYEYLTGEEILPSDQRRVMEQVYIFSFRKSFRKAIKSIEDRGKKHRKATEDHWKQSVESNELIKKDFNIDIYSMPLEEQIFHELVEERSSEFRNLEKKAKLII